MFNTTINKAKNYDLQIAAHKRYQDEINWLKSDLRKSCTPEQLELAENIAEKFRDKLIFKYITAENSVVNAVVWKEDSLGPTINVSFALNGRNITVKLQDIRTILRANNSMPNIANAIKKAICDTISKELMQYVLVDVINAVY